MNENIFIKFMSRGALLEVADLTRNLGIRFAGGQDGSPLNISIGIKPVLPQLLAPIQRRHDWRNQEFMLDAEVESGGVMLSGYEGDPEGLPPGPYDITVQVESYRFRQDWARVVVKKAQRAEMVLEEEPDRRRIALRDDMDTITASVVRRPTSIIDGMQALDWLRSSEPRPARQACLLNILAKMRVPASRAKDTSRPLLSFVDSLFFADVDRVYVTMDKTVRKLLDTLAEKRLWVFEGTPVVPIHARMIQVAGNLGLGDLAPDGYSLESYRQGGRNNLQIVLARPTRKAAPMFADVDIDLGNPLWDLQGLFIHIGELLDPGKTDHLKLYETLATGDTRDFLSYSVINSPAGRSMTA